MGNRMNVYTNKVLSEAMKKNNKQAEFEQLAEKEFKKRQMQSEVSSLNQHAKILHDTHTSNRNTLDFKLRVRKQQERERKQAQDEQRRKEQEQEMIEQNKAKQDINDR